MNTIYNVLITLQIKTMLIYKLMGQVIARAILDDRLVEIPFNPIFWKLVLCKPISLEDYCKVDAQYGSIVLGLQEICNQKWLIEQDTTCTPQMKAQKMRELKFKGARVEDLGLTFTFPSDQTIELIEDGGDMPVTLSNL